MDIRLTLSSILIALCIYNPGAVNRIDEYKAVNSDDSDFKSINNSDSYEYWECVYNPGVFVSARSEQRIVVQIGNNKYAKYAKKIFSAAGFFTACGPGFCSYYIVAVKKDKSIKLINTPNDFRNFIGKIDNLEEAKLSARNGGYVFSVVPKYRAMYQQSNNGYIFKLYDFGFQSCFPFPRTEPKLITVTVDKIGSIGRL